MPPINEHNNLGILKSLAIIMIMAALANGQNMVMIYGDSRVNMVQNGVINESFYQ